MIIVGSIFAYLLIGLVCGAGVARHYYWHKGNAGQWARYDDHQLAIMCAIFIWPCILPYAICVGYARSEPKAIRIARENKRLEEFARREGLL